MTATLLELNRATVVRGGRHIIDDLSLRIEAGEHTAILGPNGSGKSSLIGLLSCHVYTLYRPGPPPVSILGRDRWNVFELRTLIGIVSGDLARFFAEGSQVSGLDAVLSGFFASRGVAPHHTITSEMRRKAGESLARVNASHLAERPLDAMSAGEARRVLIARSLVNEPHALLLDEPTTDLDLVARRDFLQSLRSLAQSGVTLILVTHHIEEIVPEIERVILLRAGQVFMDGPKHDVLTSVNLSALFDARIEVRANGEGWEATAE